MPKIYLFIPYYGKFPNYYQLYLDSLRMNQDILTVFFITDIDMKQYDVPENAVVVCMTKESRLAIRWQAGETARLFTAQCESGWIRSVPRLRRVHAGR